uniref:Uncharacterized protein n=1 Tax=Anguilla anguilla TaxID=7936 RepID=A0A0E9QF78_ANGAN
MLKVHYSEGELTSPPPMCSTHLVMHGSHFAPERSPHISEGGEGENIYLAN